MAIQINIARAKARLSELVARAEAGEEVVIARAGKPAVVLTPRNVQMARSPRRLGLWDHLCMDLPEDLFIGSDPEIEAWLETWIDGPIYPS